MPRVLFTYRDLQQASSATLDYHGWLDHDSPEDKDGGPLGQNTYKSKNTNIGEMCKSRNDIKTK